jgi:hypothetical protein
VERLATEYRRTYQMLRVYRDDLERIVAIFKENCDDVTIEAEGYKLSDISDLDQLQEQSHLETLSQFQVTGGVRGADNFLEWILFYVRLNQSDWRPVLHLSEDSNAKLYGAAAKIDAILSARRDRILDAVTSWWAALLGLLIFVAAETFLLFQVLPRVWTLNPRLLHDAIPWNIALLVVSVLNGALAWGVLRLKTKYRLIVYLADFHERKRLTRDQQKQLLNGGVGFVLGVLSTVVSALIVLALTR